MEQDIIAPSPMVPQPLGALMELPFMSWPLFNVHLGTLVMAAPGAAMEGPKAPSLVGPRLDQL